MNKNDNNIKNLIDLKILKTFFEKKQKEWKIDWEIKFNISWSIKWPDIFWNYLLKLWDKKYLLDENLNVLSWTEFISIIPFDERCYIWNLGWKCVFFDTKTNDIIEIAEHEDKYQAKIFWKNTLSDDEYFINISKAARIVWKNEKDDKLKLLFKSFLIKFLDEIKNDIKWDDEKLNYEISKFWESCEKYIRFLIWAYKYMYEWNITKYLSWKSGKEWNKLKNSNELKKKFPNIYLAMHELDDIENVLLNEKWNVLWYLKKVNWKYHYINSKWNTTLVYDDFRGPDKFWNIITKKDEKSYFLNWNFEYPFFWFDEIIWSDNNWNYLWKSKDKYCLIIWTTWKILKLENKADSEKTNEPNIKNECFKKIEWPDNNKNYIVKTLWWFDSYLVNGKWKIISESYFKIESNNETWNYNALSLSWNINLDKNGKIVK